jgi:lipopolysaccharide transport system permease protein
MPRANTADTVSRRYANRRFFVNRSAMRGRLRHSWDLVLHLAKRELTVRNRWTLLGWAWPLTRQLAQLGVLVFLFSSVFDLGIKNYAVFAFAGLMAYNWFSSGLGEATSSLIANRQLVFQPRFPAAVLPIVSIVVPFADLLLALPVLLVMLAATGTLHASAVLFLPLLCIQLVLMCGIAWLTAALSVYLRDVPNIVLVGLTLLFYVTPVFYGLQRVPERFRHYLELNPLTTLIESYRAVLLDQGSAGANALIVVTLASLVVAVAGLLVFRRLQSGFVDEL